MKAGGTGSSAFAQSPSGAQAAQPSAGPSKAQTERRVSFAPHMVADASASAATSSGTLAEDAQNDTLEDGEDSICFNSDDDAFLATIDLGEEGIGGPIEYDQGARGVNPDGGTKSSKEMPPPQLPYQQLRGQQPRQGDEQQTPRPAWRQQQQQPKPQQRQLQVPPQQVPQQQSNVQQRQQQTGQQIPQPSSVQHSRTLQASSAQQSRPLQAPSHANDSSSSNQRQKPSGSSSNSNPLAEARNSSGLTSQNKGHIGRSPTPSMGGGFNFPAGVVCNQKRVLAVSFLLILPFIGSCSLTHTRSCPFGSY
ncbi:uncharacterized protein LAESUDRAFT_295316 [Laetiporus sulphureus 93-53]|uniref:Uncharacterized protein n=1 Tax=Laetiporus sulphureus 93-53 TaxID=1314785 RepID=A0A165DB27_9APHY|nr:uncharacterized protein LAESUDRAFT_295316 [Laetiporus sulphureus 93-53]KZT04466.1 hypothetical protein LAESUDRAFT_295316 [Laetiporus sulphureus 93-53]